MKHIDNVLGYVRQISGKIKCIYYQVIWQSNRSVHCDSILLRKLKYTQKVHIFILESKIFYIIFVFNNSQIDWRLTQLVNPFLF